MPPEPPSPSTSSILLPFLAPRSRRGSLASINSKRDVDKDIRAQALDSIHVSASRSGHLTSFHDFDGDSLRAGSNAKEMISSGMNSLYNRFRSSVSSSSPSRDGRARPVSQGEKAPARKTTQAESKTHVSPTTSQTVPSKRSSNVQPSPISTTFSNGSQQALLRPASRDGRAKNAEGISARDHARDSSMQASLQRDDSSLSDLDTADDQQTTERSALATYALAQAVAAADGKRIASTRRSEASSRHSNDFEQQRTRMSLDSAASRLASTSNAQRADSGRSDNKDFSERPPLVHVGVSHLPGFQPSEVSSPVLEMPSSRNSQIFNTERVLEPSPNINSALQRRRTGVKQQQHQHQQQSHRTAAGLPPQLKRRVISKEFWMKDENAKVCFDCGQTFTAFRRKHHCRTCGQIFDAKCTSLVEGRPFGQSGTLRLCKACEDLIFGSDQDDSSVYTDEVEDELRTPDRRRSLILASDSEGEEGEIAGNGLLTTPSMGIPASRRNREAKRRSAVIEFDAQPTLVRPASSRSLFASGRPRSSSHKRHQSRAHSTRSSKSVEDSGPFAQGLSNDVTPSDELPVFHNDNVIDPDLAPYMSDEEFDDEGPPDIFTTMDSTPHNNASDRDKLNLGGFFSAAARKGRPRTAGSMTGAGRGQKDDDAASIASRHHHRLSKRHTPSFGSINLGKPSPRRSRSHKYLKGEHPAEAPETPLSPIELEQRNCTKITRSCAMRSFDARPVELNRISFEHVRRLLAQLLADAKVEQAGAWEKALLPILLQCTEDVDPDVPRGDDMDIRHYIKLKKVPGGRPGDTSYVSGVVFSKNIALKSMARSISNPRIAIVTFAIEYARHQSHFMSLEPVIAQEREYLSNLVGRIAALRPQLLLVQRRVSGLALDMLAKAGITVAYNIKESVLAAVARVTQTTMIKSVDKLTIDPHHLGHCEGFDIKTYVHEGARKSYVVLSGCQPDLGCTVVLRGADTSTLRRMKRITEFMCYVVYNLKLETYLLRDEFASMPSEIATNHGSTASVDCENISEYAGMERRARTRIISVSPFIVYMQPHLLTQLLDTETKLTNYKHMRDAYAAADDEDDDPNEEPENNFKLIEPAMVRQRLSKDEPKAARKYLHAAYGAQYDRTMATFETQKKLWQSFLSADADPFDPFSHQSIVVLHSTVSSITSAPCMGPELLSITFYAGYNRAEPEFEEDCTLGQYIEDMCLSAGDLCKGCNRRMLDHHRQYVHGNGQLSISVQRQPARLSGMHTIVLMWSVCKKCSAETTVVPMSDNSWKFSFAKYLESSFWSRALHPRAGVCEHDIHKDFVRCFGFQDLVVRVQYDPIDIYDVVVPRTTVSWRVEADLAVKNEQYQYFETRLTAFIESIKKRLSTINVDTLDEKQMMEAQEFIDSLRQRADDDHEELLEKLQSKYLTSSYYELIPLNRALRFMDKKALSWDEVFANFERDYFPSETDIRKLAAAQLKEMFYGSQSTSESMVSAQSDTEGSELTTFIPKTLGEKVADEEVTTEKTHDVLASVAQEHRTSEPDAMLLDDQDGRSQPIQVAAMLDEPNAASTEDVKHLDLAIPERAADAVVDGDGRIMVSALSPTSDGSSYAPPPEPLSSGLVQRIEQIRKGVNAGQESPETKIPRLSDLKKREEVVPTGRPRGFSRARSQPANIPQAGEDNAQTQTGRPKPTSGTEPLSIERRFNERLSRLGNKLGNIHPSLIPRSIPTKTESGSTSVVSALAKHFEHLSREFERERLRERRLRASKSRQARANPLASSRPVVEVYKNATEAVDETQPESVAATLKGQQSTTTDHAEEKVSEESPQADLSSQQFNMEERGTQSFDSQRATTDTELDTDISDTEGGNQSQSTVEQISDLSGSTMLSPSAHDLEFNAELSIPEHKRNVWFKVLAEFWSKRSASGWSSLEYPLHSTEHVFEDSDIIVREDEPSSVIALSLSSSDYINKVKEFRSSSGKTPKPNTSGVADSSMDALQSSIESSLLSDVGTHMRYSFSHGPVKATCKIFYAEAFDALRRRCDVTPRFVESLSRCMKFDSKGGKTKSLFLKTLDNRFIIKSLQEVEVKAFTRFAPDYFAFMSHTLFRGVPSVIAKMFGLFQVIIKNPASGMDFNCYLLVMENLFYDHIPNRRFDLKGSMRNRKIESTGQPDEVLLDENLVETIFESPLFVREHSRRLLHASVWNDTLWLCKQNVMDYSLMAGFEDSAHQLVVGIIDCIRTYTWDKRLETWIKDRGKNKPTITSPKDYRNRFRVSMTQYVLQAPSCWHQFQASMAPPKTLREKDDLVEPGD